MPYFSDLNTYLHQSSRLIQAYPSTRITTKYSLPRKPHKKAKSKSKDATASVTDSAAEITDATTTQQQSPKRERSATLTLKTYHPQSGICLKYRTDKAAEVGRLLNGLGRLAKGEIIDVPNTTNVMTAAAEDDTEKMDINGGGAYAVVKGEDKIVTAPPAVTQGGGGGSGGGKGKKKKGKMGVEC